MPAVQGISDQRAPDPNTSWSILSHDTQSDKTFYLKGVRFAGFSHEEIKDFIRGLRFANP
jgi:hypothetical protein